MSDTNKQVELIRTSFLKNLASVHPLKEHPIDNCEEYVQKLYIDALTVTAQYENKNAEAANKFIQRIMAGAGLKEPFTEHLKNAFEITPERYGEFLKQCAENKLTDIFLIDSMIVACAAGEPNKKQVDFVAETADMLAVRKNRFEWLTGIAKCILMQSSEEYKAVCEKIPHDEKNEILPQIVCYLKEFVSGVLLDTDDFYWVYSREKTEFKQEYMEDHDYIFSHGIYDMYGENCIVAHDKKKIIFENIITDHSISLSSCNHVEFKNCELVFVGHDNVGEAHYDSCIFDGKTSLCDIFDYSDTKINVLFTNCKFANYKAGEWDNYKLNEAKPTVSITADNCKFANISRYGNRLLLLCNGKHVVKNCEFINCGSKSTLWDSSCVTEENNTFIS